MDDTAMSSAEVADVTAKNKRTSTAAAPPAIHSARYVPYRLKDVPLPSSAPAYD